LFIKYIKFISFHGINVALNWTNEFEYGLNNIEPPVDHYQLTTIKPDLRVTHLNYWYEQGRIMIMEYY
jgi:hypothetical protein